jgi:hypothetical protein
MIIKNILRYSVKVIVLPLLLLVGCGEVFEVSGGGIGGTGIVTGFGSVVIDGKSYSLEKVSLTINGVPSDVSELSVGMLVEFLANSENTLQVLNVDYLLEGLIQEIDFVKNSFKVAGQEVLISPLTVFSSGGFYDLFIGQRVRVNGTRSGVRQIRASYLSVTNQPFPVDGAVNLLGEVLAIDAEAKLLTIPGQVVDYSQIKLLPPLSVGNKIQVVGFKENSVVKAEAIKVLADVEAFPIGLSRTLYGVVQTTEVSKNGNLEKIQVKDVLVIVPATLSLGRILKTGDFVRVEGIQLTDNRVEATVLTIQSNLIFPITGFVQARTERNIVLAGTNFVVDKTALLQDEALNKRNFSLRDVALFDKLRVTADYSQSPPVIYRLERLSTATPEQ